MEIKIDDNVCLRYGTTKESILVLGAIQYGTPDIYQELISKGLITAANASLFELDKKYTITNKGINLFSDVILDSDKPTPAVRDSVQELAVTLRGMYPEGKMPGTSYYYRCNTPDIVKKLRSFFKRYSDSYTNEQIIDATQRYISSFNGNYQYLRLLKYFIWKDETRDGEIVQVSQLADWIENDGQVNSTNDCWTTELN